jgi:ADP-ribose pyrophosphatase
MAAHPVRSENDRVSLVEVPALLVGGESDLIAAIPHEARVYTLSIGRGNGYRERMSSESVRNVYDGRIVHLRIERVALPNGETVELELIRHRGASAVAAVHADGRVVLIRQYRYAAGGYIWELPAGILIDANEPGLSAREWRPLGSIMTTPGFTDERIHLFLARGLEEGSHSRDHDEVIAEVRTVPLADALAMIRRGEIVDGKTIAGLYLAADAIREAA